MKKRYIAGMMAGVAVIAIFTICFTQGKKENIKDEKELITIGFSQVGAESDWRTANSISIKETFTPERGYDLIFEDARQDQSNQIMAIRSFIQQDVDYIIFSPVVEDGWDTVLEEAKRARIPVIVIDRMVNVKDDSLYTAWVGSDFKKEGVKAAEWLIKEKGKEKGDVNIAVLQGTIGSSAEIGRTKGFKEGIKDQKNFKIIASQTGEFTQAKGQEVMESFLKQNKDIDVVVAQNDNMAFGAIDALKAAGKTPGKDVTIISFDAIKAALKKVQSGEINAEFECNPLHGPRVAELAKKIMKGEKVDKIQYVDEQVFTKDNTTKEVINKRAY